MGRTFCEGNRVSIIGSRPGYPKPSTHKKQEAFHRKIFTTKYYLYGTLPPPAPPTLLPPSLLGATLGEEPRTLDDSRGELDGDAGGDGEGDGDGDGDAKEEDCTSCWLPRVPPPPPQDEILLCWACPTPSPFAAAAVVALAAILAAPVPGLSMGDGGFISERLLGILLGGKTRRWAEGIVLFEERSVAGSLTC